VQRDIRPCRQFVRLASREMARSAIQVTEALRSRSPYATGPSIIVRADFMTAAKFAMNDTARLIGTDTVFTVKQCNEETRQYLQRGDDIASVEPARPARLE
jgi:hypothetical protein